VQIVWGVVAQPDCVHLKSGDVGGAVHPCTFVQTTPAETHGIGVIARAAFGAAAANAALPHSSVMSQAMFVAQMALAG
jgi:hypothetical protein